MHATIDSDYAWPVCPTCGCREVIELGTLGALLWFRCRACGTDHHHVTSDPEA